MSKLSLEHLVQLLRDYYGEPEPPLYAGLGAGLYHDLKSVVQDIVSFEKTYEPDPAAHRVYQDLYEQWSRVYQRSLGMVEEGLLRPLWRAAGT